MNSVITAEQAKKITGGRTPLVPIEYETAVNALQACVTLDEAKTWSDKADALAAWAKIYRNDDAGRKAKQLKLHAYRRMGELAGELRPVKPGTAKGCKRGSQPGPFKLLVNQGLKHNQAAAARAISKIPADDFEKIVTAPRPLSPSAAREFASVRSPWAIIREESGMARLKGYIDQHAASEVANALSGMDADKARYFAITLVEWLDEFEQRLPKRVSSTVTDSQNGR